MNKNEKKLMIVALSIFIIIVVLIILVGNYKINLELTNENIKVNIYDTLNLNDYIKSATDNKKQNLKSKVKINVEADKEDEIFDNKIFIKGFGDKKIKYSLKRMGKTVTKTLNVIVITDPNDIDFKPNYDYEDSRSNNDDKPMSPLDDTPLTEEEQNYINSFLN